MTVSLAENNALFGGETERGARLEKRSRFDLSCLAAGIKSALRKLVDVFSGWSAENGAEIPENVSEFQFYNPN